MKTTIRLIVMAAGLVASHALMAQAPAGAPAGSNGQCKDGTYSNSASKSGACRGHQGVKDWWGAAPAAGAKTATSPAPAAAAKPATTPAPAAAPAPAAKAAAPAPTAKTATAASTTPAPGGGPGMVWVNTSTKVYHCAGTKYYGTTKEGKYMSEADAKAMGAHADHNKPCGTK